MWRVSFELGIMSLELSIDPCNHHGNRGLGIFMKKKNPFRYFAASSIDTATATLAPTIGLLPIPRKPIIST